MFEHVVIGVEFSPGGEAVLRSIPALRTLGTRRLTLVNVIQAPYSSMDAIEQLEDASRERLGEARAPLEAEGFEVRAVVVIGDPAREICSAAEEVGASLVLVGSRSHSRVVDAFLGSVAWGVVHRARMPVLVQRVEPARGAEEPAPLEAAAAFDRILFPTDWSDTAARAQEYVEALARLGRASSFLLLHVRSELEETHTGRSAEPESLERLEAVAERLRREGSASVEVESPSGAPFLEITERASRQPGTLIIMGTRGRGIVGDAFLGSVSRDVVRNARSPVLLIPPGS